MERMRKMSSSSCSGTSSDSSSGSCTSSCSSSTNSSTGSSSNSNSSSSSTSSCAHKKKAVQKVGKKSVTVGVTSSEKKSRPTGVKEEQDKGRKVNKVLVKTNSQHKEHVSPKTKVMKRSPSPHSTKIHIGRLTRNITRDHIQEIFLTFGKIKTVDFPLDRIANLGKGFAYVDYETAGEAENAMKHMDGAQIDGQEITAAPVLIPRHRQVPVVRRSSPALLRRPLPQWGRLMLCRRHSSILYGRGRLRSRVGRSRSPARRRRYSSSSSSST